MSSSTSWYSFVIIIKTLTFDGAASNISMASLLGANLNCTDLKTNFKDPSTENNVHVVLDQCHMVKLIRNCLGDWEILFDKYNRANGYTLSI